MGVRKFVTGGNGLEEGIFLLRRWIGIGTSTAQTTKRFSTTPRSHLESLSCSITLSKASPHPTANQ